MYNLVFVNNNKVVETLVSDKTFQFCNSIKTQKLNSCGYTKDNLLIVNTYNIEKGNLKQYSSKRKSIKL